jgi:glucosamine--fructose-6-phosphate aminotransferase (isomerizing)
MCGIIGYVGKQDPKGILLDGLSRLEYRGYDSAGIAVRDGGKTRVFRVEGRLAGLERRLADAHFDGFVGLGHTRWATHGAPIEKNAHPHRVGVITLVHNGIIENYLELKQELVMLGRTPSSDTDSEIVAHLFDLEVSQGVGIEEAAQRILPRLKGSYAFVVLSDREPEKLLGARNGVPLLVGFGEGENYFASDVQAVLHRTRRIAYLKDHEVAVLNGGAASFKRIDGATFEPEVKTISWTADQMEKAGYRHYMQKEIFEQPSAIANTLEGHVDHHRGGLIDGQIPWTDQELRAIERIDLVACGTARHAALIGKYLLERYARVSVDVDFGSEFRYRSPVLENKNLFVCVSQSGETADTLAALREAKGRGMKTLALCNVRDSSIPREADHTLYTNAGPEIGVASTKAFTTQVALLYLLAIEIGFRRGTLTQEAACELTHDLLTLPIQLSKALEHAPEVERAALEFQDSSFYFFLGRDILFPMALEGSLKLKEVSYAHSEGYPAGEIKHGPIALVDRHTTVVVLAPRDKTSKATNEYLGAERSRTLYEKMMSNLQEVKSRGAKILAIGSEGDEVLKAHADYFLAIPATTWGLSPITMSVPLQLFAYYTAVQKGTDVDKPRNLAKSVTVE